jgi:predicted transcriptional regulator
MLVGEFDIAGILEADPKTLWEQTRVGAGITKPYFDSYFEGRTTAFAIRVGAIRAYDIPIAPAALIDNFSPPQSYRYVSSRETNTAPHQETATNYALW